MNAAAFDPGDPQAVPRREQWRREQRQIARLHHPDVGGDPKRFLRLMRELDQRHGITAAGSPGTAGPDAPVLVVTRTGTAALWRRLRRYERVVRSRLPRRVPGSRRHIDL
ncbi:hypothetical protein GCM10022223_18130 [Kineosporia mesophila]|uniref:Molecular chaperone DnaJ n=1 Tax=Kineosporia mesophila TaxID=566012 RepID=A0ABP6ZAK9_9ACTN|nr:hypothetical protein [Kineosporia mesophila]MCD5351950.1 hypothetical protein [Kineosporia mesophila]